MIFFGKKIFLVSLIFLLIFSFLVIFMIPSLTDSLKRDSDFFISLKKTISLTEGQIEDFENFRDKQSFYNSKVSEIKDFFINPEVPIAFLEFLEDKATELNLSIKISPINLTEQDEDPWDSLGFQIMVTGSPSNCLKYLEKVQLSRWLLEVRDLEIQKISERDFDTSDLEKNTGGDIYMVFSLKVYSQSPKSD
jgi:hypothetical protein